MKLKNIVILRANVRKGELGFNSQEYAALWGSDSEQGRLFYEVGHTSLDKLGWTASQWYYFCEAIKQLLRDIVETPRDFEKNDERDLKKLLTWAEGCMNAVSQD